MLQLDILNAKTGHTVLTFDPGDKEQAAQAEAQVNEMLKLGFGVFAEIDGKVERVTKFEASNGKYLIGGKEAPASTTVTATAPSAGGCVGSNVNANLVR